MTNPRDDGGTTRFQYDTTLSVRLHPSLYTDALCAICRKLD
jgi:hypothetical protein